MPESSICVFPKEAQLHVLLKQGRRGWLHPNHHLQGCFCHRHASPRGCHHPRCDRKRFLGELTYPLLLLFCLTCTVFPLSSLSVYMKAHPLCLCVLVCRVTAKTIVWSCTLLLLLLPLLYRLEGEGGAGWRALGARSVPSTTHGSCLRGGSARSEPITWENERY